jgi:hypothetical protein
VWLIHRGIGFRREDTDKFPSGTDKCVATFIFVWQERSWKSSISNYSVLKT